MVKQAIRSNTMNQLQTHPAQGQRDRAYRENWTAGGLVVAYLLVPALLVVMAAPMLAVGALLGVAGVAVGKRVARVVRRSDRLGSRLTHQRNVRRVA